MNRFFNDRRSSGQILQTCTSGFGSAICLFILSTPNAYASTTLIDVVLGARAVVTDNFYYQEVDEQSTSSGVLLGRVGLTRNGTVLSSNLSVDVEAAAHNHGKADNYADSEIQGGLAYRLGLNTISLDAGFRRDHDAFGTVRTEGDESFDRDLDIWHQAHAKLSWQRNGEKKGSLFTDFSAEFRDRDYVTNEDRTDKLDRDWSIGSALIGFNVTEKTGLYVRGRYTQVAFSEATSDAVRSGETIAYLGGIRWKATAKTSGFVEFGAAEREASENPSEFDSEFWSLGIELKPRRTTLLRFSTERDYVASYTDSSFFFDTQTHNLVWSEEWSRRLSTSLQFSLENRDFVGSAREDDTAYVGGRVSYALDLDFTVFTHLRYRDRDSNSTGRSFERSLGMVGFEVRLN